jgi:hypothetical protein
MMAGAVLADVVLVDQYEIGTALNMQIIVGQIPFSRHLLEEKLRFRKPTFDGLLSVEADQDLGEVARGDIVLLGRTQTTLSGSGMVSTF